MGLRRQNQHRNQNRRPHWHALLKAGALSALFAMSAARAHDTAPPQSSVPPAEPSTAQTATADPLPPPPQPVQPFTTIYDRRPPPPVDSEKARRLAAAHAPVVRKLTAGEQKLVSAIFGAQTDVSSIQLALYEQEQNRLPGAAPKSDSSAIRLYGSAQLASDYSSADAARFAVFINEITRLLQERGGQSWPSQERGDTVNPVYVLDGRAFASYTRSQQRALVEDYALRFLHPSRQSYWLAQTYGGDRRDTDPYLIETVENTFPQARAAREALQNIETRALTSGESAVLRSIFGDQLDLGTIRINLAPQAYADIAGAALQSGDIFFYGSANAADDYSQTDVTRFGSFVHEAVHLWQFQTNHRFTVKVDGLYDYKIEAGARFDSYSTEQQASIIEDYARRYLHPTGLLRRLSYAYPQDQIHQRSAYLLTMVEAWFPDTRLAHRQSMLTRPPPEPEQPKVIIRSVPGILPSPSTP